MSLNFKGISLTVNYPNDKTIQASIPNEGSLMDVVHWLVETCSCNMGMTSFVLVAAKADVPMLDGELPRDGLDCKDLREAADEIDRLQAELRRIGDLYDAEDKKAATEIEHLQEAKRRTLMLADERSKEANQLRAALKRISIYDHCWPENAADIARKALLTSWARP